MSRDSPEMARIQSAVKDAGMTVVLGYSEREGNTIYEAQVKVFTDYYCQALLISIPGLHRSERRDPAQSPQGQAFSRREDALW